MPTRAPATCATRCIGRPRAAAQPLPRLGAARVPRAGAQDLVRALDFVVGRRSPDRRSRSRSPTSSAARSRSRHCRAARCARARARSIAANHAGSASNQWKSPLKTIVRRARASCAAIARSRSSASQIAVQAADDVQHVARSSGARRTRAADSHSRAGSVARPGERRRAAHSRSSAPPQLLALAGGAAVAVVGDARSACRRGRASSRSRQVQPRRAAVVRSGMPSIWLKSQSYSSPASRPTRSERHITLVEVLVAVRARAAAPCSRRTGPWTIERRCRSAGSACWRA